MTRPSKRELERQLESVDGVGDDSPRSIEITETVVGTAHGCSDLEAGEAETTTEKIEL